MKKANFLNKFKIAKIEYKNKTKQENSQMHRADNGGWGT